jgi:hypothetical protein
MRRGFVTGLVVISLLGLCLCWGLAILAAEPSAELLRYMAAIGATLLIAYAIEMSAVVRADYVRSPLRESWIGFVVGLGVCGLAAIVVSLALGERSEAHDWLWVDQGAFAFATGALFMLGVLVTLLPSLHYEWLRPAPPADD